jgi:hypothetical protein
MLFVDVYKKSDYWSEKDMTRGYLIWRIVGVLHKLRLPDRYINYLDKLNTHHGNGIEFIIEGICDWIFVFVLTPSLFSLSFPIMVGALLVEAAGTSSTILFSFSIVVLAEATEDLSEAKEQSARGRVSHADLTTAKALSSAFKLVEVIPTKTKISITDRFGIDDIIIHGRR